MNMWRISKYNPAFRNSNGAFTLEDWTSISDIGKSFRGVLLSQDEYMRVEDSYVDAIKLFLHSWNVAKLVVVGLEKYSDDEPENAPILQSEFRRVSEGDIVEGQRIETISRLVLREYLWCKLEWNNQYFVHFGYDYYMYVGGPTDPGIAATIEKSGLFAELFESPYLDQCPE